MISTRQKVIVPILALLTIVISNNTSHSFQYWARTYGGNGEDIAYATQQTDDDGDGVKDDGYIVTGHTGSFGAGGWDFWVLKLDSNGSVTWQKTYGGGSDDDPHCIQQTSDGGYILAGGTRSFGAAWWDFWVLKLDSNGSVTWQKTFRGNDLDDIMSIQQTSDGGYILGAYTKSFGAGAGDFWVLKLNSNGDVAWQKTFGGGGYDFLNSIQQTTDGGYILAGCTNSFGTGTDYWVLKLDSNGNIGPAYPGTWQKTYGGSNFDMPQFIQQTSDGGYIVAGFTMSFGAGDWDYWVLKLDSSGNVSWQKTYGGSAGDCATYIQQTVDGGYVVSGVSNSFGTNWNTWVLKLDSSGNVSWQRTYGETAEPGLGTAHIQQTSDAGYIVAGMTIHPSAADWDIWVLKLDCNGELPACTLINNTNASISSTSVIGQDSGLTITDVSAIINETSILPQDTSANLNVVCEGSQADADFDGMTDLCDNCPNHANGHDNGTCVKSVGGVLIGTGMLCTDNATCASGQTCQMNQEDMNVNGIGDACECYADANHDGKVNTTDLGIMKVEFFRTNCATVPCQADLNGDNKVNTSDLGIMKVQFFKTGCPVP